MNKGMKIITFILLVGLVAGIVNAGNWAFYNLPTVNIPKSSADGTKVYDWIGTWCLYPNTLAVSTHSQFQLYFVNNMHLRIKNIQQNYLGSQQVTLYCNGEANKFTLNIVNSKPVFTSTPVTTGKISRLYIYNADATDADGDTLTYSLVTAPAGMTINSATGVVIWTPKTSQAGLNLVKVAVTDGKSTVTQQYSVNVDAGVDVEINAKSASGLAPLRVQFTPVIKSGDGPFTLHWDFDSDGVVDEINTLKNALLTHHSYHTYELGTYTATLTVVDAQGDTGVATIGIKANPKPKYLARRMFRVDRLRTIGDYFKAGDEVAVFTNFQNDDNYDMKHVKITSLISELGVRKAVGPFRLDKGDEISKRIFLELPEDTAPGVYNIRTTISNYDGIKRIKYRTIVVK